MKRILVVILTIVVVVVNVSTAALKEDKRIARKIEISKQATLPLVKNGKSNTEIVLPDKSNKVAVFAADELQKILSESFGSKVAIVSRPTPGKLAIILGNNKLSSTAGINVAKLPRDGFIIKTVGKNIYIAGIDDGKKNLDRVLKTGIWAQYYQRGTLFGVYDFLERFVGVRFFFPGKIGTVVPKHKTLLLPARINIIERPDFIHRKYSIYSGKWYEGSPKDKHWYGKNLNYYRLRSETRYVPNCHGLSRIGYLKRYGKTNPEYFALMANGKRHNNPALQHAGQLCFSSGVVEQIYQDAAAFLSGKSAKEAGILTERFGYTWDPSAFQPGYFNIMPQDGLYLCRGAKCQKHYSKGKKATSDFIWNIVINVANRLKKNGIPGYVTMMSYPPYNYIPARKIPDNVLVMTAVRGPWQEHQPVLRDRSAAVVADWTKKMNRKTWLWNYVSKYGSLNIPGIPILTPEAIGRYYQREAPNISGAYLQSGADEYILGYLNYYVFSKVAWDNKLNLDALLSDHYQKMFGAAAEPMRKIYDTFEYLWINKIAGKSLDTALGPVNIVPSEYDLWKKIYSPQQISDLGTLFNEAEMAVAKDKAALKRVIFMRRKLLGAIIAAAKKYRANKNEIADLKFQVKTLKAGEQIKLDGKLDDKAWQTSSKIYLRPYRKDKKSSISTMVYSVKDGKYLYFAFDCKEPAINKMSFSKRKADDGFIWRDSSVELFLNPSGDRKDYYQILVNAVGSVSDNHAVKNGSTQQADWSWNSNAKVKTAINKDGWLLEIAIPLAKLARLKVDGFPINFNRNRVLTSGKGYVKLFTWSPFLTKGFHDIGNFGSIAFGKQQGEPSIVAGGDMSGKQIGRNFGSWITANKTKELVSFDRKDFMVNGQSLKLVNKDGGRVLITQRLPQMKPNTKYLLTFYIKTDTEVGKKGAFINIWDDKNLWFPKNKYNGVMPWSKQGFEFISGPYTNTVSKSGRQKGRMNRSYMRLWINAKGTVWFDDVRIREVK
ncbi:MAG: DUF4838 domain-containing protein [Victivallaceae bacterium]|nr:DUF4838 domain-containing protein [Victivallaceae bacterium]